MIPWNERSTKPYRGASSPLLHHAFHDFDSERNPNLLGNSKRPLASGLKVLEHGWAIALYGCLLGRCHGADRLVLVVFIVGFLHGGAQSLEFFGKPWEIKGGLILNLLEGHVVGV